MTACCHDVMVTSQLDVMTAWFHAVMMVRQSAVEMASLQVSDVANCSPTGVSGFHETPLDVSMSAGSLNPLEFWYVTEAHTCRD